MEVSAVLPQRRVRHQDITVHLHQPQPLPQSSRLMPVMHLRHTADNLRHHTAGNLKHLTLDSRRHLIAGSLKRRHGEGMGMGMMGLGMMKGRPALEKAANRVIGSVL